MSNAHWRAAVREYILLCQLPSDVNRPDYRPLLASFPGAFDRDGEADATWKSVTVAFENNIYEVSIFVKKLIISRRELPQQVLSLSVTLERGLRIRDEMIAIAKALTSHFGLPAEEIRTYAVVLAGGPYSRSGTGRDGWLGDSLTTFSVRAYDSRTGRVGVVRISRHIGILYDLSNELVSDIFNLIYENFLYSEDAIIDQNQVFSLLDALGRYVLPTEVSLHTNRIASKFAVFATGAGLIITILGSIQDRIPSLVNDGFLSYAYLGLYLGFVFVAWLLWLIADRISGFFVR